MRALILVAGAALSLAACGGNDNAEANADMNAMSMDANMTTDANMMMDANGAMMDANAMGPGGVDGNTATNTEQEMQKDQNTNAPDSNLANGL